MNHERIALDKFAENFNTYIGEVSPPDLIRMAKTNPRKLQNYPV